MMTHDQIEELFIAGAETEKRLPPTGERPATLKAQAIPYFHTEADVKGWGGERYSQERADFLSNKTTRLKTSDVSKWELCNELMAFVPRVTDRKFLWAWAKAEVGTLLVPKVINGQTVMVKGSFSRWCNTVMRVHRNTGTRRKNAAIACIASIFVRNTLADIQKLQNDVLQEAHKISDKSFNIEEPRHYRDADVIAQKEQVRAEKFSWVEWRNRRRKELAQERERRQSEAA